MLLEIYNCLYFYKKNYIFFIFQNLTYKLTIKYFSNIKLSLYFLFLFL